MTIAVDECLDVEVGADFTLDGLCEVEDGFEDDGRAEDVWGAA